MLRKDANHLHLQVQNVALCWSWICPGASPLLTVEVELVAVFVGVLCPGCDLVVHLSFHLLTLLLECTELLPTLLWIEVCVPEVDYGLVRVPVDVLQGMSPRTNAGRCVVVKHTIAAIEVLSPLAGQWGFQGLNCYPQEIVVSNR